MVPSKPVAVPAQQALKKQVTKMDSGSDSEEPSDKQYKPQPPSKVVATVTTMSYANQAVSQVRGGQPTNSVLAGFVGEEQLIRDSEAQRNIDLSELKNLLI